MQHTRNPSTHAAAWKARALSALRANSSLSVRLARYNDAMAKARALEVQALGGYAFAASLELGAEHNLVSTEVSQ